MRSATYSNEGKVSYGEVIITNANGKLYIFKMKNNENNIYSLHSKLQDTSVFF